MLSRFPKVIARMIQSYLLPSHEEVESYRRLMHIQLMFVKSQYIVSILTRSGSTPSLNWSNFNDNNISDNFKPSLIKRTAWTNMQKRELYEYVKRTNADRPEKYCILPNPYFRSR